MKFDKAPLDIPSQLQLLKNRGLSIPKDEKAIHYLTNVGYFRLSGYTRVFQIAKDDHNFIKGTTFDNIIDLYYFDRQLKLIPSTTACTW